MILASHTHVGITTTICCVLVCVSLTISRLLVAKLEQHVGFFAREAEVCGSMHAFLYNILESHCEVGYRTLYVGYFMFVLLAPVAWCDVSVCSLACTRVLRFLDLPKSWGSCLNSYGACSS